MRRTAFGIGAALGCLAAATGAFRFSLELDLPDKRIDILALLAGGTVLAVVGGLFLGGPLWRCVRRGGKWWILPAGAGIVSGVSFYGVLSPFGGYPLVESRFGDSLITGSALAFLAANSCVVGRVLLPRRREIPARRALGAVALLYGSMLAGIVAYRVYPLTWSVPLATAHRSEGMPRKKFLDLVRETAPYPVTTNENEDGSVSFRFGPSAPSELKGYPPWADQWHDDVIVADATEVVLPEGRLRLEEVRIDEGDPRRRTLCFSLSTEGRLTPWRCHELLLLPWETSMGRMEGLTAANQLWGRKCIVWFRSSPPIPGPLQLRFNLLRGEEVEYLLPNEPGAFVRTEKNGVQLLRWVGGGCEVQFRSVEEGIIAFDLIPQASREVRATAVLALAIHEEISQILRIDALKTGGGEIRRVGGRRIAKGRHRLILVEVPCASDEIHSFRIVERPRVTQVRLPVPPIPEFPPENYGIDDALDMRVPWSLEFRPELDWGAFPPVATILWGPNGVQSWSIEARGAIPESQRAPLREILDQTFPGGWQVKGGRIVIREWGERRVAERLRQAIQGGRDSPSIPRSSYVSRLWPVPQR